MSIRIMSESEYAQQRRAETMTATEREIMEKTAETPAFIENVNAEMYAAMGVNR